MKASRVVIAIGSLCFLVIAFLVHRFRDTSASGTGTGSWKAASQANRDPEHGWIAHAEPPTHSDAGVSGRRPGTGTRGETAEVPGERATSDTGATTGQPGAPRLGARPPSGASRSESSGSPVLGSAVRVEPLAPLQGGAEPFAQRLARDGEAGRGAPVGAGPAEEVVAVPSDRSGVAYDSGDEARFPTDSRFKVPQSGDFSGEAGTVSFQFEPGWSGDNQADASLLEIGDGRLVIRKNVHFLRLEMTDNDGNETGTGVNIAEWEPGEPHRVSASWGGGFLSLYVDGNLVAQQRYASHFDIPSGTPVYVGTGSQSGSVAPGSLSSIRLSNLPAVLGSGAPPAPMGLPGKN